jgi:replication factor A1
MGAIEDIYADLDTEVSEEEFQEAIEEKVAQMDGLVDEETAAQLLAHELADNEVEAIADIDTAMDEVKFLAKVRSVGDLNTFDRDDGEGTVVNVEAADETGSVRLAFWDEQAEAVAAGELDTGDVLRVKGTPKDGYNGLEVSVTEAEPDDEVDIEVATTGDSIEALTLGQSDVTLRGLVLGTDSIRTFDRDDGSTGQVANLTLGDETGRIRVTLWDDQAERAEELDPGTAVEVVDGYVKEREGDLELHVGDRGAVDEIDETVEYDPDATAIGDIEIGTTVDIAGVVRSTDPVRTFDRDDGSEGKVRNVRVQDETDDLRVALWGDKADKDIAPGDEILAADVEIQDGWQDDLEASAGWQSTVVVLEDADTTADSGPDETNTQEETAVSDGGDSTGLGAFSDGERPAEESDSATDRETVEFTGTVVQTGNPVILDDGTETMSVDTGARVRLGEEITARGIVEDEVLDADEIL